MPPLTDILPHVIRFLDVVDLARLLSVCQAWYRIGHQAWIWRRFCLEPGTSGRLALGPDLLPPGLDADQMRSLLVSLRRFSSPIMPFSIIKRGIYQSSCDHESQTISQTLDSKRDTFWSSTGSASSADGALLVYELAHGLCVVRSISITPFRAFYQQGMQCYGPVRARVTILLRADDDSSITYRGPWASIDNRHEPQAFDLGRELIVGGAFRLELDGRWSRQPGDHLYYVCLRDVVCKGVPVAAAASDAFLRVVHARVRRSDAGRAMPYRTLGRVVFQDRTAIQAIVVKELTRQRLLMKCKALIGCEQIDDVVAIVFPAYADDVAFRDDVADALLASDDTSSLASYIGALDALGGVLSDVESIMVAQLAIRSANATPFGDYVAALRVSFTERLGDLFFEAGDYACAMTCFSGAMIPDKLLITCAHLCSRPGNVLYLTVLMRTYEYGPETVAMIVAILRRRHHPHIACVFVDRMLQDGAIDLGTAATLLQVPSPALPSYMRKQASLFQESCDRSSGNASSSLEP